MCRFFCTLFQVTELGDVGHILLVNLFMMELRVYTMMLILVVSIR